MEDPRSQASLDRSLRTIQAAGIFLGQVEVIAQACQEAHYVQTVVAMVSHDLNFHGVDIVLTRELKEHLDQRQEDGWMLLFSADDTAEEIEQRCIKMENYARMRSEAIQRWLDKQA